MDRKLKTQTHRWPGQITNQAKTAVCVSRFQGLWLLFVKGSWLKGKHFTGSCSHRVAIQIRPVPGSGWLPCWLVLRAEARGGGEGEREIGREGEREIGREGDRETET